MPLIRYNALSVLRNINLADSDELNETIHSIARCLDTTPGSDAKRMAEQALELLNKGPILRIVRAIERTPDYPLLRMAVERLLECRDRSRLEILGAVSELEHLAEEKVLINPEVYFKEYVDALEEFMELPPLPFGKDKWLETPAAKSSPSDGQATPPSPEQSQSDDLTVASSVDDCQSDKSTTITTSVPEIVKEIAKDVPARKPLPNLPPNSTSANMKPKPSNPRRKKATLLSEEYATSSPPASAPATPTKRGKATKACDECRRRKVKCLRDELDEKCTSCTKMGRNCVLSSPSPVKPAVPGSVKRAATEELSKGLSKAQAPVAKRKSVAMKNILHNFGDLKEGKSLGIVSEEHDGEESSEGTDGSVDMMDVGKATILSDPEDFDYKPNKRVCLPSQKVRSRSIRKTSSIAVE
ncbi:hypothetical protein IFR05_008655 [Cadophora sp. M221]|nr:hypothetical protein IFR05_008655 [Cadophora sp. M221]